MASSADNPSSASATTSMDPDDVSARTTPSRNSGWSSPTTTRTFSVIMPRLPLAPVLASGGSLRFAPSRRVSLRSSLAVVFGGHEVSVAQLPPVVPPNGGPVIHPCRRPIAGHTKPSRCTSLESSPEHPGARPKSQRRQDNSHVHYGPLPPPAGRRGRHPG